MMSSMSSTTGSYFDERTLRFMKMGPGTVSQLGKDTSEVDFPLYFSKRSCGMAFVGVHNREQMVCNAFGRTVPHSLIGWDFILATRDMQRHMVPFRG